jgi:hypothetical protein
MNLRSTILLAVASVGLAAACNDAAPPVKVTAPTATPAVARTAPPADDHHEEDNAQRISLADAKKDFDAGKAVIVDVRDANAYAQEHIKGSLNIPLAELNGSADKLPKGKKIIAYCS